MKDDMLVKLKDRLWDFPITRDYLSNRYLNKNFSVEMELLKNKYRNNNHHPSIIHFSVNKAATQYVSNLLRRCAIECGMVKAGLAEYAFHTNFPYLDQLSIREMEQYRYLFKPEGYLYSVFGGMIEGIPQLEDYHVILMLRDPRDVLVSEYYSYGFSHAEPSKLGNKYGDFMKMRRKAREVTVNDFVESECDRVYANYQRYISLLLNQYSHVFITKYEEMTLDFQTWLKKLFEYCELEISDKLLTSLLNEAQQLRPSHEDVHQHIRKAIPGDYKEKLESKTIDILNSKFQPILERLNYEG